MTWSLHDAKNRLSQLVRDAAHGPQTIAVRGEPRVVVLSIEDYDRLRQRKRARGGLRAFLQASPWADVELDLERGGDEPRALDLIDDEPA